MPVKIHPSAIVDPRAELGAGVEVGPFTIIDRDVVIGARTIVGPHVRITGRTSLGEDCVVHTGAVLGEPPQDHKYHDEVSYLRIGHRNVIREFVTMHLAVGEGNMTVVGDDCMFMAYTHIGHNCHLGSHICAANYVGLAGGCRVDDRVVLGGHAGFHQFCHIGRMAMVGGFTRVAHDVPPFVIVEGPAGKPVGLNTIGLRRNDVLSDVRGYLQQAFRMLCYSNRNLSEALAAARTTIPHAPEVNEFISFLEQSGRTGRHLDPKYAKPVLS